MMLMLLPASMRLRVNLIFLSGPTRVWIHNECITSWIRHDLGMVSPTPTNFLLRPVHETWHGRHHCIYFHEPPVETEFVHRIGHKDDTGLVIVLKLVSALAGLVLLVVVVDIVYIWLRRWWPLLLLLWRVWLLLLHHWTRWWR